MNSLIALLVMSTALVSCSNDKKVDTEEITYCPVNGYLTNLTSAQHGIVGTWSCNSGVESYSANGEVHFHYNMETCTGSQSTSESEAYFTYAITEEGKDFFLTISSPSSPKVRWRYHIDKLNKTELSFTGSDGQCKVKMRQSNTVHP